MTGSHDPEAEGRRRSDVHRKLAPALAAAAHFTAADDPFAHLVDDLDEARIVAPEDLAFTPERMLIATLRPLTAPLARLRKAERDVTKAVGDYARRRAESRRRDVRNDPAVKTAIAADLDAERALLMPIIRAAIAGTHPRWRLCRGRIIDEKGRGLMPQCVRPWQTL